MLGTILFSSKTRYGRNRRNIPYYLFVPLEKDNGISSKFIVASKLGNTTKIDHYAIIEIIDVNCNPYRGAIQKIIGPVNNVESNVEFILYKYNILPRASVDIIKSEEKQERLDLTDKQCYSIDPEGTIDIDDAFHFEIKNDVLELGIHITDLSDINLTDENFKKVIENYATFYLHDLHNMRNLSLFDENLCNDKGSLLLNKDRNCISLIITFGKKIDYKFVKTIINNKHTISYEKADKLIVKDIKFKKLISMLSQYWGSISDSHLLIEKMMIFYNNKMAEYLKSRKLDIPIKVHQGINADIFERYKHLDNIDNNIIKKICYFSSEYINSNKCENPFHYGLNISLYTHASSPLRRAVDYIIQNIYTHNKEYDIDCICQVINEKMKKIKKAYRDITKIKLMRDIKDRIYDAIVIDFNSSQIIVYIEDLDIIHSINIFSKLSDVINIDMSSTTIKIFHKQSLESILIKLLQKVKINIMITPYEHNINKKIRLFMIEPNLMQIID